MNDDYLIIFSKIMSSLVFLELGYLDLSLIMLDMVWIIFILQIEKYEKIISIFINIVI